MREELLLPRVGMNMEEGTVAKWHKSPGETFRAGEPLYELETDKVVQVVEASADGTLVEILVPEGEDAAVGAAVAVIDTRS
ncbi:MAG: biotin/lipoyl-containing protein [Allosphingosinicella sp.]|uniref:biotin/lipoyl-containing protein n=1 Tax=Allosphingosinicella sp. TaxID=2823234 RepID=UPI0039539159